MTATMNRPARVKLDHCPPWCAGHDGVNYQGWEDRDDGKERSHESEGTLIVARGIEDVTVAACQVEDALGILSTPTVTLYACADGLDPRRGAAACRGPDRER